MELPWHGALQDVVVTAPESKISSGMLNRFVAQTAFAAILADRTVVTWGDAECGGDSSRVQDQLRNVEQICGTDSAFAAILADGTVVTWGAAECGGDSSRVQDQFMCIPP